MALRRRPADSLGPTDSGAAADELHPHVEPEPTDRPCRRVIGAIVLITACGVVIAVITLQILNSERAANDDADDGPVPSRLLPVPNIRPAKLVRARYGAVTADGPVCSEIGSDILGHHGGSAVDAAIASLMCLGVVNRELSGIGGGHFMTIYDTPHGETSKRVVTISARERAPAAAHENMYVGRIEAAQVGGLSIAVPSEVAGCLKAWQMFGKLPWRRLLQPTINLLREGVPVGFTLEKWAKRHKSALQREPLLSIFLDENGEPLKDGDVYHDEILARTLERLADYPWSFYNGSLAEDIVEDIRERDGIITLSDLANYEVRVEEPLQTSLQGGNLTLYSPQSPASGAILNFIMKLMDEISITEDDVESLEDHVTTYHRIVEAFKFAYAKRTLFGDKEFVDLEQIMAEMESPEHIAHIRQLISDIKTFNTSYYNISNAPFSDAGTCQVNVLGPSGAAVSITSSINYMFGSQVRGRRTGILFNNEMDDFSSPSASNLHGLPPSPANFVAPDKAPMSSMTPAIILDRTGNPVFIFGGAGGSQITTSMAFVALHLLYLGMPLDRAINLPRLHHQLLPEELLCEEGLNKEVLLGLRGKGHEVTSGTLSIVSAIYDTCAHTDTVLHNKENIYCIQAVTDGRRSGKPAGY